MQPACDGVNAYASDATVSPRGVMTYDGGEQPGARGWWQQRAVQPQQERPQGYPTSMPHHRHDPYSYGSNCTAHVQYSPQQPAHQQELPDLHDTVSTMSGHSSAVDSAVYCASGAAPAASRQGHPHTGTPLADAAPGGGGGLERDPETSARSQYNDVWECGCGIITHASFAYCSGCRYPRPMGVAFGGYLEDDASASYDIGLAGLDGNCSMGGFTTTSPHEYTIPGGGGHAGARGAVPVARAESELSCDAHAARGISGLSSSAGSTVADTFSCTHDAPSSASASVVYTPLPPSMSHDPYSFGPHAFSVDVAPQPQQRMGRESRANAILEKRRRAIELLDLHVDADVVALDVADEPPSPSALAVYC